MNMFGIINGIYYLTRSGGFFFSNVFSGDFESPE